VVLKDKSMLIGMLVGNQKVGTDRKVDIGWNTDADWKVDVGWNTDAD
jgi:hypothetical protein